MIGNSNRFSLLLEHAHYYVISSKFPGASQTQYIDLLNRFRPTNLHLPLRRFGRKSDGGYVLLDAISPNSVCVSLGIADEMSFDEDLSPLVRHIYMFDYSITAPPVRLENGTFHPLRVVPSIANDKLEIDIKSIFEKFNSKHPVILKVDIEGSEWESMKDVSREILLRCEQIVFEFHDIQKLFESLNYEFYLKFLDTLTHSHTVINTHINNWDSFEIIQGVPVPNVLEVTYVRNDLVEKHSGSSHLERLNYPNNPSRPDFLLYPFDGVFERSN
jgi:hypothetical protein